MKPDNDQSQPTRNQVGLRLGEMLPGSTDNGERGVQVTGKPASQTTAVLTDRFEIVVVRADTSSERHGRCASIDDAIEWAMRHRDNLRLASTASWYVQETSA